MGGIDKTIIKETKYIAYWVVLMSVIMEAVFLIIGKWDYTVLLGNLLTGIAGVLNFFLMGLAVQKALQKDTDGAKSTMRTSQVYRKFLMLGVVIVGFAVPCFNRWAVVVPLFFPRIAIAFRAVADRRNKN